MAVSDPPRSEDAASLDEPIEAILVDTDDEPTPKPASPTSAVASTCS
jgi:hypothetical protein